MARREPPGRPHRWTRGEMEAAVAAGALGDLAVELIDGTLYDPIDTDAAHEAAATRAEQALRQRVPEDRTVRRQAWLPLGEASVPRPDVAVLDAAGRPELLVEVGGAGRDYDRIVKAPLYARARVPEVWLVDLVGEIVERFAVPSDFGYRQGEVLSRRKGAVRCAALGIEVAAADLLG